MNVLKIMFTSTTMIIVRFNDERKVFPPQTFETLYEYSFREDWEFGNGMIDLVTLQINSDDPTGSPSESKLVKATRKSDPVVKELYKIKISHDDQAVYLPGDYTAFVLNSDNTYSEKKIEDLKAGDNILTKMFGNVIHALAILDIASIGEYELEDTFDLELDEGDAISVGIENLEIFVK